MACQMEAARLENTTIELLSSDKNTGLRATGSVVLFDGFLKLYEEGRDDPVGDDNGGVLPKVSQGAGAEAKDAKADASAAASAAGSAAGSAAAKKDGKAGSCGAGSCG